MNYKEIIRTAELEVMAPDNVAAYLHMRAQQNREEWQKDEVSAEVEAALLARNEPAINLALARNGRFFTTLKPLFFSASPGSATRLSVLSNRVVEPDLWLGMPEALLGDENESASWLASASVDELVSLFENPTVKADFLRHFLEGGATWEALTNDGRLTAVYTLSKNHKLRTPQDLFSRDGYAVYEHGKVRDSAWSLASSVPNDEGWAYVLASLFAAILPGHSFKKPLEVVARWMPDSNDDTAIAKEAQGAKEGYLTNHQQVRKSLARLALNDKPNLLDTLLASEDPALRAAAYAFGNMTPSLLSAAYTKDGKLLFTEALENLTLWRTSEGRDALWEIARDPLLTEGSTDLFGYQRRAVFLKHPDWFGADPSQDAPVTKADIKAVSERVDGTATQSQIEQLKQSLHGVGSRVDWIWWVVIFVAAAVIARLFK